MALVFFLMHGRLCANSCAVQAVNSAVWHPGQRTEAAKCYTKRCKRNREVGSEEWEKKSLS